MRGRISDMPRLGRFVVCVLLGGIVLAGASASGRAGDTADWAGRALARTTTAPLGLGVPPHPADNPPTAAKIALGRKLFFDRRLSLNGTMSCAMCHVPEQAFTNNELATAIGVEGRSTKRNAPSLLNVAYVRRLFHDGRETALETQYLGPLTAHNEMANPSVGFVVSQLKGLADYAGLFEAAFGAGPSVDRIGAALASYQRTLIAADSRFDRWRFGGKADALTAQEKRGFALFAGKAGCVACHPIGERVAPLTDQEMHDIGYGWMREGQKQRVLSEPIDVEFAPGVTYPVQPETVLSVGLPSQPDIGRYEVTQDPADRWVYRTPSLRNVALTGPYMHDGGIRHLGEVVAFYNRGGAPHEGQDPRIRPLGLSDDEIGDLVAFLGTLTSPHLADLIEEARIAAPDNREQR